MKFSAVLIASIALAGSAEGSQIRHYDDELHYPFGSPYTFTETANHDKELKQAGKTEVHTSKAPVAKKQVEVIKPVVRAEAPKPKAAGHSMV